jgi:hypothetical protein
MIHFLELKKAKEINRIVFDQTMNMEEICTRAAKIIGKSEKKAFPNGMSLADGMEWAAKQSAEMGVHYAFWLAHLSFFRYLGKTSPVKFIDFYDFVMATEIAGNLCHQFSWSHVRHTSYSASGIQNSISLYPTRDSGEF